ncbi:MAG: hypothetical protein VZQ61_01085 [Christensenellaceae bacterium]
MHTLSYENKDKTLMNTEKEQYLKFYNKYVNSGIFLATTINVLEYFSTNEKDIEILQKFSPNFYNIITYSLWAQAVIVCNSFFASDDDMKFYNFFKYVSENFEKIFTGDFYTYKHINGKTIEYEHIVFKKEEMVQAIRECKKLIKKEKEILKTIKDHRNLLYAHFSADGDKFFNNSVLEIQDLKNVLFLINNIINKICVMYDRRIISLEPINATDIYQVLAMLKRYDMFHEEIANMYQKKIEEDISKLNN